MDGAEERRLIDDGGMGVTVLVRNVVGEDYLPMTFFLAYIHIEPRRRIGSWGLEGFGVLRAGGEAEERKSLRLEQRTNNLLVPCPWRLRLRDRYGQ